MAWVDIPASVKSYDGPYNSTVNGKVYVTLQYDDSSITATSVKCRFKLNCDPLANYWDEYHVILNPSSSSRSLHLLKTDYTNPNKTDWTNAKAKVKWPYIENSSFTLTKSSSDKKFIIPEFWLANDGWHNTEHTVDAFYNKYNSTGTRKNYKTVLAQSELASSSSEIVITPVGKGTITIKDNYNNTFTITGTKGANGENNPASGPTITWSYDSATYNNSGAVSSRALDIATPGNATRTVYAKSTTGAKYGSDAIATTSLAIKQYVVPNAPGTPVISYKKNRLTIKESWTFTWTAATAANASSPIKGYRIRLYKNGSLVKGLAVGSGNNIICSGSNEWLDRETTSCTLTLDPVAFGFKAGDTVKLGIYAYTRNGSSNTGTQLFNGRGDRTAEVYSATYTVQNAGILHVKPGSAWKEGQVFVKVAGAWKEAESVHVKTSAGWKESQ